MNKKRIMIVEDEGITAMQIKSLLLDQGYEMSAVVAKGEDAVKNVVAELPDLILMDIRLAGEMSGIEAARIINKIFDVPIIYITANADDDTIELAKPTQPYGYLIKPLNSFAVNSAIEMALYRHEADVKRRQAEEALRKSEKSLRDITSSLAEGIYVLDEQGKIIFTNNEAERLLGYTADELNEKGTHDLFHHRKADGSPLPLGECGMHRVIETGRSFVSSDEVFIRKDGMAFPISVIASPIIEDGKVVTSVIAFRDITERKEIEKEREKLIDELQKALATIKTLRGIVPICSFCKKIRDDQGYWKQLEMYIHEHTEADFSHGICPDCLEKHYPEHRIKEK